MDEWIDKIQNMDCLEGMGKLPDNSVDLVLTDPPYNLKKDFKNDNLKEEEFIEFFTPILKEMGRIIKPKHSIIVFFDSGKKQHLFWKSLLNTELNHQKTGTLYKPAKLANVHNRLLNKSESFFVLSKTKELNHEGQKYIHDTIVVKYHSKMEKIKHPTVKNIEIIKNLIWANSIKEQLVLDPFMGSGTTAVACKQLNRRFIGFEISPEYCKIAEARLKAVPKRLDTFKGAKP